MNSCNNCRWLNVETTEYAGVGRFYCKLYHEEDPIYGEMQVECSEIRNKNQEYKHCDDWEQGGLKGLIERIKAFIKRI